VDRILSKQGGFQVSKGKQKGAKEMREGETKSKGIIPQIALFVL
jgi:hypothetical protein